MVRIEKLKMQGFKSFAKKTAINFPSNFSVICGANGSGKSNIGDSVVFVLGRSSAKSLRADRMLEMIFHGGKNRKPAEFAEVSIQFDNSDKKFPLEENKVIISRKVNRKGISIYKLNGKTVTREKVLEVLRVANIQPDGHNIILQGDVTEVIEMSHLERREIIDEISGISEYDEKRLKAQRELLTVEERVKESLIILNERFSLLEKLKQESKAAEEYKKLSTDLDKTRASLASKKLKEAETAMNTLEEKILEKDEELKKIEQELGEADNSLDGYEKALEDLGKKLIDRKDIALLKETEKIRGEISRKKYRISSISSEQQRLDNIIDKLEMLKQRSLKKTPAVKEILKLKKTGIYGAIATLSSIPNKYQTAIEVAAGSHINDIIVKNKDIAIECIKFLKTNKIGRATFLPLDKIKPRKSLEKPSGSGVIDFAINLIKFDKKYFNAFSFVLGDTLVIDNINTAKELGIGKFRYVTLDGDLIERSGAMIGGFYRKVKTDFESVEIKKYENQKTLLNKEKQELEKQLTELEKQLTELSQKEVKETDEFKEIDKNREKITKGLEESKKKRKNFYEKRLIIQNNLNRLKIKKARLEAELENIKIEFENYKDSETYELDTEILERKVKELILSIQNLGPINMKAIDEYKQQRIIYDELKSKVDRLEGEREKILSIMTEIESKRKETFSKTLEKISNEFKEVFKDLTNGEADLRLDDPENLESGLIIEASPEGKKLLNIDAMSGGEKTLTALAFLFAIQRYKPAPFYILDEIDAALDKPNTKKMNELIKKYSEKSQFIVITHNDLTIQMADSVYGVSMSEGESQLVGIKMP